MYVVIALPVGMIALVGGALAVFLFWRRRAEDDQTWPLDDSDWRIGW